MPYTLAVPPPSSKDCCPISIALTREDGQNVKLRRLLEERLSVPLEQGQVVVVELPCIEHGAGPDTDELNARLQALVGGQSSFDSVVLTSPEAARVFLRAWADARQAAAFPLPILSVGKGTSKVIRELGSEVAFEPSVANAETLAAELPGSFGNTVMYPASAQAKTTLQDGLAGRGFRVERLNTYTTQPVAHFAADELASMDTTRVATFGSPSAVKAWSAHTHQRPFAACIGGTSRAAAEEAGFQRILAPAKPGLDGWAGCVEAAVLELLDET